MTLHIPAAQAFRRVDAAVLQGRASGANIIDPTAHVGDRECVAYVVANGGPARVTVIGRADRVGSAPDNLALSARRASAVRDALVTAGVPAATIDTSWIGEGTQPAAAADDTVNSRNRAGRRRHGGQAISLTVIGLL